MTKLLPLLLSALLLMPVARAVSPITSGGSSVLTQAQMTTKASDANAIQPVILYAKNVTVLTTGAPADVATITIPSSITRWKAVAAANGGSGSYILTESQTGTPAAASYQGWDAAAGAGAAMLTAGAAAAGVNAFTQWSGGGNATTGSTLYIRQTANSLNAAVVSFYVLIYPLP